MHFISFIGPCFRAESNPNKSLQIWHQRFCHVNLETLKRMAESEMVKGLPRWNTSIESIPCETCMLGKMSRLPFKEGRERAYEIGKLIHSDLMGPIQVHTFILSLSYQH